MTSPRPAAEVRAEEAARASRVDAYFDALAAQLSHLQGVMHADGFLPDRRKEDRNAQ